MMSRDLGGFFLGKLLISIRTSFYHTTCLKREVLRQIAICYMPVLKKKDTIWHGPVRLSVNNCDDIL